MNSLLKITVKRVYHRRRIEELVRNQVDKLQVFFDHIIRCRVVVDMPHKHHRKGNFYQVHIDILVPGEEIVVNRESGTHVTFADLEVALIESFDSARRQLQDYSS